MGKHKRIEKIFKEDNLIREFNEIAASYTSISKFPIQNVLQTGITIAYIRSFCMKYDLSFYALDYNNKCIDKYVPLKTNYKSLIFRILNGHIYPIEDISKRKSITTSIATYNQVATNKNLVATSKEVENKRKQDKKDARADNKVIIPNHECVGNSFILQQIKNTIKFHTHLHHQTYPIAKVQLTISSLTINSYCRNRSKIKMENPLIKD